jgi:hypothetical protein
MYRFFIGEEEWILRFMSHRKIEMFQKEKILQSIKCLGKAISSYSHGESFILFDKQIGAIIFDVIRIPSCALSVSNIIPKDSWYRSFSVHKNCGSFRDN